MSAGYKYNRTIPDRLPNKLSELLTVAVNDFRKVLKRKIKGVTPNMGVWVAKNTSDGPCQVCLAGAALVGTCKVKPIVGEALYSVPVPVMRKAHAINNLRTGDAFRALDRLSSVIGYTDPSQEQINALAEAGRLIRNNYRDESRYGKDARYDGRAPLKVYDKAAQILAAAGL